MSERERRRIFIYFAMTFPPPVVEAPADFPAVITVFVLKGAVQEQRPPELGRGSEQPAVPSVSEEFAGIYICNYLENNMIKEEDA